MAYIGCALRLDGLNRRGLLQVVTSIEAIYGAAQHWDGSIKKATPNVGNFEISNYRYVFDGGLNPKRPPT